MASNRPQVFPELHGPEWLRRRYNDEQMSTGQIAAEMGCSSAAVSKALARHQIEARGSTPEPTSDDFPLLIERHRRPTRTAPALKPQAPDASLALLLRCDYGWVDPNPDQRALLVVPPSATLDGLATSLVSRFDEYGDRTHLDAFYVRDDGTAEASWHKRTLGRRYWCEWMPSALIPDAEDKNHGGCQEDHTVASVMGLHYTSWFRFDFGSEMFICVRVVGASGTCEPDEFTLDATCLS